MTKEVGTRPADKADEVCEKCGSAMSVKSGRYGPFLACNGFPACRNTRPLPASPAPGGDAPDDAPHATCPNDGEVMVPKSGRFGVFLACTRYPACKQTLRLVRGESGRLEVEVLPKIEESCPECASSLAWRHGRFGAFVACTNYPTCKYIKKESKEVGLLCPECHQAPVVERKGRFGRPFFGCRRYPECRFTAYHRPIPEPCPDCARPYLLEKESKKEGKIVFCSNEACHFKRRAA
jgi:DNA topoisomerase-1